MPGYLVITCTEFIDIEADFDNYCEDFGVALVSVDDKVHLRPPDLQAFALDSLEIVD